MNTYDRGIIGSMAVTFWQAPGGSEAGGKVSRLEPLVNPGREVGSRKPPYGVECLRGQQEEIANRPLDIGLRRLRAGTVKQHVCM